VQGAADPCKGLESRALGDLLSMPPMQPDAAICKEGTARALLDSDALLTVEDAANRLAVSKAMAYRLCRAGLLRAVRVGRCVRVHARDLEAFIDHMRRRAAPG
jgi:excisionase family DNA binding protein